MNDSDLNRAIGLQIAGWKPDTLYFPAYASNILLAYEAEELLGERGLQPAYERALLAVIERDLTDHMATPFQLIHATARQRCEAMLEAVKEKNNETL